MGSFSKLFSFFWGGEDFIYRENTVLKTLIFLSDPHIPLWGEQQLGVQGGAYLNLKPYPPNNKLTLSPTP